MSGKKRAIFSKQRGAGRQGRQNVIRVKTLSVRTILVPIDFSRMSIQAIETARVLAGRFGATVHLVHVRPFFNPDFSAPIPPIVPYSTYFYDQQAEKAAARGLILLAKKHQLSGATTHLLRGAPAFDEICRLARDLPADLIVMPTHGRTGLKHVFLGSTAERIVQHSPCPVLVVRQIPNQSKRGERGPINTILAPVDFSDCSLRGLRYAIGFADRFAAKIIVFHTLEFGYAYTSDGFAMYDLSRLQKAAQKEAEQQLRRFVRRLKFGRVPFETAVGIGNPIDEIAAFAGKHDVDIIVTSTHGLTGLKHVLIGSTAEKIVRHAPCSVLVVPSHPEIRKARLTRRPTRGAKIISSKRSARSRVRGAPLTRKHRKIRLNPFPERRKTNKFRESHPAK